MKKHIIWQKKNRFNRYIVECKYSKPLTDLNTARDLIDT